MAEIICGIVQPDYSGCCDGPVTGTIIVPGPEGPPGPPGPAFECPVYCGTGEPEGVVTSVVGGLYLQTDRSATSHPYFAKRTGIGNTGWVGWSGFRGSGAGSFAIGDNALAPIANGIAFGESTVIDITATESIAIGPQNTISANTKRTTVVGTGNSVADGGFLAGENVLVGRAIVATFARRNVLLGNSIESSNENNTIVGHNSKALNFASYTSMVGRNNSSSSAWTEILATGGVIGDESQSSTAIGLDPLIDKGIYANAGNNTAIGCVATIHGANSIAIDFAVVNGDYGNAIGQGARVGESGGVNFITERATAIGGNAKVKALAHGGQAFGYNAIVEASHTNSIALGRDALTTKAAQLIIGSPSNGITEVVISGASAPKIGAADAVAGTDVVGTDTIIFGGRGRGSGTPGKIILQACTAGGSGTTLQAEATIATIDSTGFELASGKTFKVNSISVVGAQQAAIANAVGGDEVAKINAILAAIRTHGLIAT